MLVERADAVRLGRRFDDAEHLGDLYVVEPFTDLHVRTHRTNSRRTNGEQCHWLSRSIVTFETFVA
ncbi:hypothetical protein GCM10010176_107330 [Nonomuraea spiralis]|nr:hypothetical protein GCM10010176_107330 [Nonomuraea spiralis]